MKVYTVHEVLESTKKKLLEVAAERDALMADAVERFQLAEYDAGFLNDFGGGNVGWWQDYIRSELGNAYDFYQSQIEQYAAKLRQGGAE